jgi:aspartyl-tRNA(Asn)/glutamyl-tRNA(Gln) amidotransferase subunit A
MPSANTPAALSAIPDPLDKIDISTFAQRIRTGETSSEAATCAYLERIAILNRKIGAFRFVDEAKALERAREIDKRRQAGEDLGPLMGLPIAVKEIFRIEDLPFGAGSDMDVSDLTPAEGPFVKALKQRGCVILGNTKSTEFAATTINSRKSMPWNPWDADVKRVCSGSSHGSASALAAGLCSFAIGSDTGGSVRLPAALCGVVGLKPTMGIWSTEGVFPLSPTFDTIGTFTWSVADTALVFGALTGQPVPGQPPVNKLRLARVTNLLDELDPPVAAATARAIARIADAGVTFVDIAIPEAAEVPTVFARILAGELVHYLGRNRLLRERAKIDPVPWSRIESEIDTDSATLAALRHRHRELIALIRARTDGCDALVCPTTPLLPCPVADVSEATAAIEWNRRSGRNTRPGNLFGQCGISLPAHRAGELPVGLQLLSKAGTDSRLLAIAASIEAVIGRGPNPELSQFANRS